jgi:hypothetical protein
MLRGRKCGTNWLPFQRFASFFSFLFFLECAFQFSQLKDFAYCAKSYGRIIISEHGLPSSEKQIKPVDLEQGHAGGEKFIVNSILFKVWNLCNALIVFIVRFILFLF